MPKAMSNIVVAVGRTKSGMYAMSFVSTLSLVMPVPPTSSCRTARRAASLDRGDLVLGARQQAGGGGQVRRARVHQQRVAGPAHGQHGDGQDRHADHRAEAAPGTRQIAAAQEQPHPEAGVDEGQQDERATASRWPG